MCENEFVECLKNKEKSGKTRFVYSDSPICTIHEIMKSKNYCGSGKILKNFLDVHYNFFDI